MEAIKQCQAQVSMSIEQIVAIEKVFETITDLQRELKATKEDYQHNIMSAHRHIRDLKEDINAVMDSLRIVNGNVWPKDSYNMQLVNIFLKYTGTTLEESNQNVSNA